MRNIFFPHYLSGEPIKRHSINSDIYNKKQESILLSCLRWAIQGLNLGPPDYESVALTN